MASKSKEFRIVVDGDGVDLYFKTPNHNELTMIDLEYRRIHSLALRHEVMSEAEARKQHKSMNAWSDEDEKELQQIGIQIAALEHAISNPADDAKPEQLDKCVAQISELRGKFLEKINTKTELFSNTAEGMATEQKMHKFVELCLLRVSDDRRFFDSMEQYEKFAEEHRDELSEIYKQAFFYEFGMPEDITANWPEVKYLKNRREALEKQAQEESEKTTEKKAKKRAKRPKTK